MSLKAWKSLRRCLAISAALIGVVESYTIWYAVTYLGKYALLPFIRFLLGFGTIGLIGLFALRSLIVVIAYRFRLDYVNAALVVWWGTWSFVNLLG